MISPFQPPTGRPNYGYQEAWIGGNRVQSNSDSIHQVYSHDLFQSSWDASTAQWDPIKWLNGAVMLLHNEKPDAPMQTLAFGRIGPNSTMPPIIVPKYLQPAASQYIALDPNAGTTLPTNATPIPMGSSTPYYPVSQYTSVTNGITPSSGIVGLPEPAAVNQGTSYNDPPFIPSSLETVAADGYANYANIVNTNGGIMLHNVWNMVWPTEQADGRRYLAGYGPVWGQSTYAGPTFCQVGAPGSLRVKVMANRSSCIMERIVPIEHDIGRDSEYPWIFPYMDKGEVHHQIQVASTPAESTFSSKSCTGPAPPSIPPVPNLGFRLNMEMSVDPKRASSTASSGVTPQVRVRWGDKIDRGMGSIWAQGFELFCTVGEIPKVLYNNGNQILTCYLSDSPLTSLSSEMDVKVDYIGTNVRVQFGQNQPHLIRAYDVGGEQGASTGVYVTVNRVQLQITNCTLTFSFSPLYHNPWDPTQRTGFYNSYGSPGSSTAPSGDDTFSAYDFPALLKAGGATAQQLFAAGQAKLVGSVVLTANVIDHADPHPQVKTLLQQMQTGFWDKTQCQGPTNIHDCVTNATGPVGDTRDYGHLQCILDPRHNTPTSTLGWEGLPTNATSQATPVVFADYGHTLQYAAPPANTHVPIVSDEGLTRINFMIRANTTHTSPVVLGFKVPNDNVTVSIPPSPVSITQYVSDWSITWSPGDGQPMKVMQAEADLNMINPPEWLVQTLVGNQMRITITNAGYPQAAKAYDAGSPIGAAMYSGPRAVFDGISVNASVGTDSAGKTTLSVSCKDMMHLLDVALLETNCRFDQCSYYMAFVTLLRCSDYFPMFEVRDPTNPALLKDGLGQQWMNSVSGFNVTSPTPDKWTGWGQTSGMYGAGFGPYGALYFGTSGLTGTSWEVKAGVGLMDSLKTILSMMDDLYYVPLFFYDPGTGTFVLTFRGLPTSMVGDPINGGLTPLSHPWIISEPVALRGDGFETIRDGIPLLKVNGKPSFTMRVDTENLASHVVAVGEDRIAGVPIKAAAENPNWNILNDGKHPLPTDWAKVFGHTGYISKLLFNEHTTTIPDHESLMGFARNRMGWLMRPRISVQEMTALAIIAPGNDGSLGLLLAGMKYDPTYLEKSTITWNAKEGTLSSSFSAVTWPTSPIGGGS
jgi:hypothetical protein